MSKFFMVQHNIIHAAFYGDNIAAWIEGTTDLGPGCGPLLNKELMEETGGTLYQHSVNFPPGKDIKIGWCIFEAKPGSDWTVEKLKAKQDAEKKDWAVQDVYEINEPAGLTAHFKAE